MTTSSSWQRFRWLCGVALVAIAAGCGSDDAGAVPGTGGAGGGGGASGDPASLEFESPTLTMIPDEVQTVTVQATPPGQYRLRFALLGDARDASLDASEVDSDADGAASVRLTAPSSSTTFTLRASAGATVGQAGVSVSSSGFATLQITPLYTGKRGVAYWVASVRTGTTCAELSGKPLDDGDLMGTAPFGKVAQVSYVPVGPPLAVTVRGGYSVAGCLDIAEVRAGGSNPLTVAVADLPIKLSETDLVLELGIDGAEPQQWAAALEGVAARSTAAMLAGASDDVDALLAAMAVASGGQAGEFAAARAGESWDSLLTVTLGGGAAQTALRARVVAWMAKGAESLIDPSTFSGSLVSAGKYSGGAVIELTTVAGIAAEEAGFSKTNSENTSWKAEPGDTVLLGTKLGFQPSRLLTALAEPAALAEVPTATSLPQALANTLSCKEIALALVAPGPNPTEIYAGCNVACVRALCEDALVALWQRARDVSLAQPIGSSWVDVTAAGDATVDDMARPTGFSGSWVGSLSIATENGPAVVPLSGPAAASLSLPPS
jgi:hypothetical protein